VTIVTMPKDGKLALLPVSFETMRELLLGRFRMPDLPADLEVLGVQQISIFQMVEFVVRSASFAPLRPGDAIPRLNPFCQRVTPAEQP